MPSPRSILKAMLWNRFSEPASLHASPACLRREAVPPAEWLGGQGCWGDWLLFEGAATNNKFAYIG